MPDSAAQRFDQQLTDAVAAFRERFGREPQFAAAAPGRVNLIGEHTDYNDGFVFPIAIEYQTLIVAARREDNQATVVSASQDQPAEFAVDASLTPGEPKWANYVKGVVAGCLEKQLNPGGFDAMVNSTVPLGGGLSSSAALEVATATLIEQMAGRTLGGVEKALICQQAEHRFAGMPCGIMDQFISAMGQAGSAMLLDCRSHETRQVAMDDPSVTVLIANTNVKHELTGGEYAERRAQCEAAAKALGVSSLRDVDINTVIKAKRDLDPTVFKRAYHVVGEIERTTRAADMLEARDYEAFGRAMHDSHLTLRDAFEVSCDELDLMVDLAEERLGAGGVYGSRMTGGGFGGCTVTLVRTDKAESVKRFLYTHYLEKAGIEPTIFTTGPGAGASVVELPLKG
jgi:galactokinase